MRFNGNGHKLKFTMQRELVAWVYGGRCELGLVPSCAGSDIRLLSLDHKFNHGKYDRTGKNKNLWQDTYYFILREGSRRTDLQLLCLHCHWIKRLNDEALGLYSMRRRGKDRSDRKRTA